MSAGWKIPSPLIPPNLIISCSCLPTTVSRALLLCACAKDLTDTQSSDYCRELCVISHFPNLESLSHQSGSGLWALGSTQESLTLLESSKSTYSHKCYQTLSSRISCAFTCQFVWTQRCFRIIEGFFVHWEFAGTLQE